MALSLYHAECPYCGGEIVSETEHLGKRIFCLQCGRDHVTAPAAEDNANHFTHQRRPRPDGPPIRSIWPSA